MPFQTRCPECHASFTVEDFYLNRWVHCADCRGKFQARPQSESSPGRTEEASNVPGWTGHDPSSERPATDSPPPNWLRKGGVGIGSVLFALFIGFRVLAAFLGGCPARDTSRPDYTNWRPPVPHFENPPLADPALPRLADDRPTPMDLLQDVPKFLRVYGGLEPEQRLFLIEGIRRPEGVQRLAPYLEQPEYRNQVSPILTAMGPVAQDAVIPRLQHREPIVRYTAWSILAQIGTEEKIPALEAARAQEKTPELRVAGREAILEIQRRCRKD